jgi:glyoxylase-like metal-dependent hydrolase (beta-lactamase superfamily II)
MIRPATRRDVLKFAGGTAALAALTTTRSEVALAAAPMLGVLRPQIYRFKIGSFEVTQLFDGYAAGPSLHPTFGNNQTAEAVAALAKANNLPMKLESPYVPTLVNTGKELIAFDTGNAKGRIPTAGFMRDLVATAGYSLDQVDIVAITHGHPDHVGGLMEGDKPAFPKARYIFGDVDFEAWKAGQNLPESRKATRELYLKVVPPLAEKTTFIKPDGEVVPGIRAVNAYGHSPGMLAFHVESEGQRLLIWGDVANHYVAAIQQPEWHVGFDDIKDVAVATRKRIFDMVATDRIAVAGFHMPFPSVGYVEKAGSSYRWVPASYEFNL